MATVFTIYAGLNGPFGEEQNRVILMLILSECGIDGYTLSEGVGVYGGKSEPSAIVTLIAPRDCDAADLAEHVVEVATAYKKEAKQEEVWVTRRQEELLIV